MSKETAVGRVFARSVKYGYWRFIRVVAITESGANGKPLAYSTITISDDASPKRVSDKVRTIQAKRLDSRISEWREVHLNDKYPEEIGLEIAKAYLMGEASVNTYSGGNTP